jgi:engulfment and cell motility protein 1
MVQDVIKQLCSNLKIQDPYVLYALRDDSEELVTDENLRRMIKQKANLRCVRSYRGECIHSHNEFSLVSAPKIEAVELVDKLALRDEKTLRLTLFSLQKLIRVCFGLSYSIRGTDHQCRKKNLQKHF